VAGGVFINYRGADSGSYGALLYLELSRHFGDGLVFLDSESIPAGSDFVAHLTGRVRHSRVLLAVIGPRWLTASDAEGRRRIEDPQDWIRRELAEAFAAGVRVIPVLTDGAEPPVERELPADIAALGRCQYRRLRHRDASADLARIRTDLAAADPVLAAAARHRSRVPRQLPADVSTFTGRAVELAALDRLRATSDTDGANAAGGVGDRSTAVVISAVSGTAGVGKTALAINWAHRVRGEFADGQLYVNLRGYDPDQPMTATDVLASFLAALGVAGSDIPLDVADRAAKYRTEMAGRRMLIVLDNASSVEQVRPLLPGTSPAMVVVTSRDSLAGLVAVNGAHRLDLDLLPPDDAVTLLRRLIGGRVDAEPLAAEILAEQCVRLPLALRVAAELVAARPTTTLPDLVAELADLQPRLDLLDAGDDPRAAVRAVFSWSYLHLRPDAARAFRLLGLHPGPNLDQYAVAALADTGLPHARRMLDQLTRAHLVQHAGPRSGGRNAGDRYAMHDLLRAYAADQAARSDSSADRRAALGRLFDYYLATAADATDRLYPADAHRRPRVPPPDTPRPALADPDAARSWLDAERPTLSAVVAYTATAGWAAHAVRLSTTLFRYLSGGHVTEALAVHTQARDAAHRTGDHAGEAQAWTGLGTVHLGLGRYEEATEHYQRALTLFRHAGDRVSEARACLNLGAVQFRSAHYRPAAEHYLEALALLRAAGDRGGEARALTNLGIIDWQLGRYQPAAERYELALTLFRQTGDREGEANLLTNLGNLEERLHRYATAAEHHQQALAVYRQLGNRAGEAAALDNLGTALALLGKYEQAAQHHQQALTLFGQVGNRVGEAWAHNGLGEAAHGAGRPSDALAPHTAALATAVETGEREQEARAHAGLANAHYALGDTARGRCHAQHAVALHTDLGSPDADEVCVQLVALDRDGTGRGNGRGES